MPLTDNELDARLAVSRRGIREAAIPAEMISRTVTDFRTTARRRLLRTRVTAVVAAGVILVSGAVAAPAAANIVQRFLAQSPWSPAAGGEILPQSEWVNTGAPDLTEYISSVYPDWLPLAPGQTRDSVISQMSAQSAANPGLTQEVSLRRSLELTVYVGWLGEWLSAHDAGDIDRMDAAAAVLQDAPSWPALVATDGGGVTKLMAGVAVEIADGNYEAAQAAAQYELAPSWDGTDRGGVMRDLFAKYIPEAQ